MASRIVVIPGSTSIRPNDRGLLNGDGVFETIHLRPDGPWLLDAHLDRMAASARLLDLPLPPAEALVALAQEAAAAWWSGATPPRVGAPDQPGDGSGPRHVGGPDEPGDGSGPRHVGGPDEPDDRSAPAALRLVCTRGPIDGPPTVYATVSPVPEATLRERRDGIRLITTDLGVSARRPPWSISGAKSISYAQNLAARRWAAAHGADDMLWFSIEGYALESPGASLVWLAGDTLCTVSPEETGVLPGTTAAQLLSQASSLGLRAATAMTTRESLAAADGIWLASALRGLAEVVTLDGQDRTRSPWTARMLKQLGF